MKVNDRKIFWRVTILFLSLGIIWGCAGRPQTNMKPIKSAEPPMKNVADSEKKPSKPTPSVPTDVVKSVEKDKNIDSGNKKVLVEDYYQTGLKLYQELKFGAAIDAFNKVLELDPSNDKAKVLLEEARLAQGEYQTGEEGAVSRKLFAEVQAKIQQAKLEVDSHLNKGIQYYNQEDYAKAEDEFQWVIESVKWFPYQADLMTYQTQAENYLKMAEGKKEIKEQAVKVKQETAARQLASQEEERRKEDFVKSIDMLFKQAQVEFDKDNYAEVVRLCEKILEKSPGNFVAEKLRTIAVIARRAVLRKMTTDKMNEEWKRTFESYDFKTLSYMDPVTFPSKEIWEKVERRGPKKIYKEKPPSELNQQTELLLKRKIKFPFVESTPLAQIVQYIREIIPNLNIIIDNSAVEAQEPISYNVIDIPLDFALKDMLAPKQWGYFIRDGVVIISSLDRIMQEQMETRWYNILDLTIPIVDFPSTEIALGMPAEADSGTVSLPPIQGDQLIDIIKDTTAKQEGGWDKVPPPTFQPTTGVLIVTHLPAVHKQIESLLDQIRMASDVIVTVESRFLRVQKTFLEDVGVNLTGIDPTAGGVGQNAASLALPIAFENLPPSGLGFSAVQAGIAGAYSAGTSNLIGRVENIIANTDPYQRFINDERISPLGGAAFASQVVNNTTYRAVVSAVSKDYKTTEVFAPKITIANGQRAHIQMTDQFTYIKSYDVVIVNAQSSAAMGKPNVDTFRTGVVLDVRPVVSTDLKYIMLELRPSVVASVSILPNIRTIPYLIGFGAPENIELPEIEIQRARGNAIIPDGGVLLMGCYASGENVDAQSNIPILSKIPLLSFMTGRKASGDARKVLVILIKAKISILSEEERKKF